MPVSPAKSSGIGCRGSGGDRLPAGSQRCSDRRCGAQLAVQEPFWHHANDEEADLSDSPAIVTFSLSRASSRPLPQHVAPVTPRRSSVGGQRFGGGDQSPVPSAPSSAGDDGCAPRCGRTKNESISAPVDPSPIRTRVSGGEPHLPCACVCNSCRATPITHDASCRDAQNGRYSQRDRQNHRGGPPLELVTSYCSSRVCLPLWD